MSATETTGFHALVLTLEHLEHENARMRELLGEQLLGLERRAGVPALPALPVRTHIAPEDGHEQAGKGHVGTPLLHAPGITYKVTSPMMKSRQLKSFQRLLNHLYARWRVDYRIEVDGEYGSETRRAARRAAFALGIASRELDDGLTPAVRAKIRHPELRSAAEKQRGRRRRPWIKRLRKRYEGGGPKQALAYARKHLGVTESPPESNRGRLVDKWNRAVGTPLNKNAFWCGAFMNACLVAAGFTSKPWMKSCPQIEEHARGRVDGWSWHPATSKPKLGDLVLYTDVEKGIAGHVGIVEGVEAGTLVTVEGNTSRQGSTASQSNGGGVFERHRNPRDPQLPVRGYARPPYRH